MCLRKLSKKDETIELRKLPEEFPCWKIIRKSGHCEYDVDKKQPKIERRKELVAQHYPLHRMFLYYPPGFHAYLKAPKECNFDRKVIKCWGKKKDIVRIGINRNYPLKGIAVAVSKIRRK